MGTPSDALRAQYRTDGLRTRVLAAARVAGADPDALTLDDLAPLDEGHGGGRALTERLADAAAISRADRVLDVGGGLGGPARVLAATRGCHVTVLDLVDEFCVVAADLNARAGLGDRIEVRQGNATDLRFPPGSFDVVWTQYVAANIEDQHAFATEVRRVLGEGGRLAAAELVAGDGPLHLPTPWATNPGESYLEDPTVVRRILEATDLRPRVWEDVTDDVLRAVERSRPTGDPDELGLGLYLDRVEVRHEHLRRNLAEGRARVVLVVADAV